MHTKNTICKAVEKKKERKGEKRKERNPQDLRDACRGGQNSEQCPSLPSPDFFSFVPG